LTDVHSIEQQALAQLRTAPKLALDHHLAAGFSVDLAVTEGHERLVAERLTDHDAGRSTLKDAVGTLTGKGFAAFAAVRPDTPGVLVVHAFSYEHMEEAAYDLLGRVADRAGDVATVDVARRIEGEEHAMGDRLAGCFDRALHAALRELDPGDADAHLNDYLADAHAIEVQALELLDKGSELAGSAELARVYREHRAQTGEHRRLLEDRLNARGGAPSRLKDAALRLGALNWGAFFGAQPDTPAKLAAFAYAFEHLEIGAYELLRRVAVRASDADSALVAERILADERHAADRVRSLFDEALEASLEEQGVAVR
jgi:ferritin-like metal-binding protein YciE